MGSLAVFKYLGFITENLNAIGDALGIGASIPLVKLTLPVGISFYTFQSMSYTIDVYRGRLRPTHSWLHFFAFSQCFPSWWPVLSSGPPIFCHSSMS